MERIQIFDTTLRDGEQAPGCSMNIHEKTEMALALERLRVDTIEAGFAVSSPGDFEAVQRISRLVKDCRVASLCRALSGDIDASLAALREAAAPRVHIFIATSALHMEHKLRMTPQQVLESAVASIKYAKKYIDDVEFSAEDATRSDVAFLKRLFRAAIEAGATTVNVADTVGYATPNEFYRLIHAIRTGVEGIENVTLSVHCHNDLGMGVANSVSAIAAGATQVECTLNGIGERAGNAALEEIVMAVRTRRDLFGADTRIDTRQIYRATRLLSGITGVSVPPNKPVVGQNAFAHESGIHQHGGMQNALTYEIMTPESIGMPRNTIILGKHSGRHAFEQQLESLGYDLSESQLDEAFEKFKKIADRKKTVSDEDLEAIVGAGKIHVPESFVLESFVVNSGNTINSTASVSLRHAGERLDNVAIGDGPIDAVFKAIDKITKTGYSLDDYSIRAVTAGEDALGEATVRLKKDGKTFTGRGVSMDIIESSVHAYISAINKVVAEEGLTCERE